MEVSVEIDPHGEYTHMTEEAIVQWCGMLPFFVMNPEYSEKPTLEAIESQYQFGSGYYMKGTIDASGRYHYPEDPVLYPLIHMKRQNDDVYIYPYGVIGVVDDDGTHVQRMD